MTFGSDVVSEDTLRNTGRSAFLKHFPMAISTQRKWGIVHNFVGYTF